MSTGSPGLAFGSPEDDRIVALARNISGMMRCRYAVAERMIKRLEVIHYAMSLAHHRSHITRIDTAALMASTYRLFPRRRTPLPHLRGGGVFPLSMGLEDAEDLCVDLDRVL